MAKTDARRGVCAALGSPNQYGDTTPDRYDGSQRPKSIRDKSVHVGSMPRNPLKSRAKVKGRFESSTTAADAPQQNAASSGRANPLIEMPTSSCSAAGWLRSGDLAKPPGRQVRTSRAQCL